ncbi:hypothetical protein [Dyadobacter psychrophilus]|uniref:Uncharacterized protein n=1 Tax=Dyadobacter psychrophilus TaxID=651661 RepID=A0A1T5EEU2_9BACT|nr:hypothetical protein [Dyadobacter psychrophilus]SKB82338.1 hypothetical protein SAMN05660293_02379 [Dyadobacter psychrophilus]
MLLHAGPVQADYAEGNLRYIRIGNQEVVRMIYFAIRDRNWNTLLAEISAEEVKHNADSFSIKFTGKVREDGFQFKWKVKIIGSADGSIHFSIHGQAGNTFLSNRAGLCVLHATDKFAGTPCCIEHPDGYFSHKYFPVTISPHQPFLNIRAMEWPVGKTTRARLDFDGDIFETEDQRNWSDASYKTYYTPLELPFPRLIETGTLIDQSVKLTVTDAFTAQENDFDTVRIHRNNAYTGFPDIGLRLASNISDSELEFVKSLTISHLRKAISLSSKHWHEELLQALEHCRYCETTLELVVFCNSSNIDISAFLDLVNVHAHILKSIIFFDETSKMTSSDLIAHVVSKIREQMPNVELGGGTDGHFADINRNRIDSTTLDFISFSLTPLAHLKDDRTMIDNMQAQFDMIKGAEEIAPGKRLHVSPITLKPRSNAVEADNESVENNYDTRQTSDLAAGWTLGSLKYLTEAGANSITYFETNGFGGIISDGNIYPVGKLLQFILNWKPAEIEATSSDLPLNVSSLLMHRSDRNESCLIIANHTNEKQTVILEPNSELRYPKIIFTLNNNTDSVLEGNMLTLAPMGVVAL